jgi:HEPN domain-containing protein
MREGGLAPRLGRFHAQQAAEKALKAAIIASGTRPARTHDLLDLSRLLPRDWEVVRTGADLAGLSRAAVEERYPDVADEPTEADAAAAIEQAQTIVAAATADLDREEPTTGAG